MAAERPHDSLDQSVSALHQILKNSEERRIDANHAYLLAVGIIKSNGKNKFAGLEPREVGSYNDEDLYSTTHYSRGIRYKDTSRIEVNVGDEETYSIFLRETLEDSKHGNMSHRNENRPGISMLAVSSDDEKRARLLYSFEEERIVGHNGLALDILGTHQALETLRDLDSRLEAQKAAESSSVAASN